MHIDRREGKGPGRAPVGDGVGAYTPLSTTAGEVRVAMGAWLAPEGAGVCVLLSSAVNRGMGGSTSAGGESDFGLKRFRASIRVPTGRVRMSDKHLDPRLVRRREEHRSPLSNRLQWKESLKADCVRRAREARSAASGAWRSAHLAQLKEMREFVRQVAEGGPEGCEDVCVDTGADPRGAYEDVTDEGAWLVELARHGC